MAGHWGTFVRDAGAALAVWRRFPILPLVALAGASTGLIFRTGWIALISVVLALFYVGWVGTERMFYLRGFRNLPITAGEAFRFTRAFFWRYLWLGILVWLPVGVLFMIIAGVTVGNDPASQQSWGYIAATAVMLILVDVALTFVTPALAFTTWNDVEALKIGIRMLRKHWPQTAWYAVLPPMAFVALTYTRPREDLAIGWVVANAIGTLVNLLAKGAVAAFYLRHNEVGKDGAAFEGRRNQRPSLEN